jgi:lipoprotein-anchoring transpeptidase ErfK/SrfK
MTGDGSAAGRRPYCVAVLLAAGLAISAGSQVQAARYYWRDAEPFFDRPFVRHFQRQHTSRHGQAQKTEKPERESGKPQGPLIIAISINQQKLKIYDANGFFAEAPVSTGMHGHPTPMGVFSVIQKHKFHHSNIYSNAPMPYMQRITWSGVAMHAGVLPGYPASHGCIRMPMAFAIKMWNWTKMGARVVVTPGELTPAAFAHALLPTQKVAPQPVAAVEPETDKPVGAGKGDPEAGPTNSGASLELRSTVGHPDGGKAATDETVPAPRDQTRTADASSNSASSKVTMSDASPGNGAPQREDDAAKPDIKAEIKPEGASAEATEAAKREANSKTSAAATAADAVNPDDKVVVESRTAGAKPAIDANTAETRTTPTKATDAKATEVKATEVKAEAVKSEPAKADTAGSAAKPAEPAKPASASKDKDQARLPDADKSVETKAAETKAAEIKAAATKADPPKRAGQIAVFISRKDSKLYVRQNFSPLFEVPVTIGPSDRPLGTHVFTADVDKTDSNLLHWSVVTLPVSSRSAMHADDEERPSRRRKNGAAAEAKPIPLPDSPAEALDRITIPADAMARVSDALTSGGSIIVSDQGINQGDTGEGTDFIVSLH